MKQKKYVECSSYLYTQLRCLQTMGMWPLDTNNFLLQLLYRFYKVFMISALAWISFSQIVQICVVTNLEERSSAIDIATLTTSGLYKMIFYIVRQKDFQRLVDKMNTAFVEESADKILNMRKWLRYAKPLTFCHIASAMCVLSFWVLSPIIDKYILEKPTAIQYELALGDYDHLVTLNTLDALFVTESKDPIKGQGYIKNISEMMYGQFALDSNRKITKYKNVTTRTEIYGGEPTLLEDHKNHLLKFPLNCWYPFDVTKSPVYEIVYLLEFITLFGSAHVYMVSDCFFFALIYIVCGQLEILKTSLKNLHIIVEEYTNKNLQVIDMHSLKADTVEVAIKDQLYSESEHIDTILNSSLIKLIKFHSLILEFLRELEVLVRSLIVADVLHAIISLSFAMLQTSISVSLTDWIKMVLFVIACIWHQFLNNYFTESLIQKQVQIVEAAYDTPWEDRPESFKQTICITVMQAYRPVIFNAYKLYYLGHTTFMEFMRALVSYFMVLRELQAKK